MVSGIEHRADVLPASDSKLFYLNSENNQCLIVLGNWLKFNGTEINSKEDRWFIPPESSGLVSENITDSVKSKNRRYPDRFSGEGERFSGPLPWQAVTEWPLSLEIRTWACNIGGWGWNSVDNDQRCDPWIHRGIDGKECFSFLSPPFCHKVSHLLVSMLFKTYAKQGRFTV